MHPMRPKVIHACPELEYWFPEGCHILELLNHPDDRQVSIARARVAPGTSTRWHSLRDTWERYLILQGCGVVELGDLEPTRVAAGDVVSIPPDTPQRIRNAGSEELIFYAICSPRFRPDCYRALEP